MTPENNAWMVICLYITLEIYNKQTSYKYDIIMYSCAYLQGNLGRPKRFNPVREAKNKK